MLEYARKLPRPITERLRSIRDSLGTALFRPKTVTRHFGNIPLTLKIADPMANLWYGQGCDRELPELAFLRQRRLRPGARVFDIGAHQGVLALQLASIVTNIGRVVGIEPGEFNYRAALANKAINAATNLTIINAAASERNQEVRFHQGLNGRIGQGRPVPSCTIDFLSRYYGIPDVVFVDVEGYEQMVLQGAPMTLHAGPDWHVEIHQGTGLEWFGGTAKAIVTQFQSAGYTLYVQLRMDYRGEYQPLTHIPSGHFYLIAVRE